VAAATASLATVTLFTGLLGLAFLPRELERANPQQYVSITHSLAPSGARPAVSLYWTIGKTGLPGWRHRLAVHAPQGCKRQNPRPWPELNPLALAHDSRADHILVGDWDGRIYSLDTQHAKAKAECIGRHADGGAIALASSPDGRYVISQSAFHLYGWDREDKRECWRLPDVAAYCFAIRPDSSTAIVGTLGGDLLEIDLPSGRTLRTITRLEGFALSVTLSHDGNQLAVLRSSGDLLLLDSNTGELNWHESSHRNCQTCCGRFTAFSPCGQWVVTAGQESGRSLAVWSVATGQKILELRGHEQAVQGAAFAADGSLRSWGADGTIRLWNLATGVTRELIAIDPSQSS
jgi:WD40 repeat protein